MRCDKDDGLKCSCCERHWGAVRPWATAPLLSLCVHCGGPLFCLRPADAMPACMTIPEQGRQRGSTKGAASVHSGGLARVPSVPKAPTLCLGFSAAARGEIPACL